MHAGARARRTCGHGRRALPGRSAGAMPCALGCVTAWPELGAADMARCEESESASRPDGDKEVCPMGKGHKLSAGCNKGFSRRRPRPTNPLWPHGLTPGRPPIDFRGPKTIDLQIRPPSHARKDAPHRSRCRLQNAERIRVLEPRCRALEPRCGARCPRPSKRRKSDPIEEATFRSPEESSGGSPQDIPTQLPRGHRGRQQALSPQNRGEPSPRRSPKEEEAAARMYRCGQATLPKRGRSPCGGGRHNRPLFCGVLTHKRQALRKRAWRSI